LLDSSEQSPRWDQGRAGQIPIGKPIACTSQIAPLDQRLSKRAAAGTDRVGDRSIACFRRHLHGEDSQITLQCVPRGLGPFLACMGRSPSMCGRWRSTGGLKNASDGFRSFLKLKRPGSAWQGGNDRRTL